MSSMMKRLDFDTLREDGYLQEVNRTFFHPLGLALAIEIGHDGVWRLCVLDAREDPEGFMFDGDNGLAEKANNINQIASTRREARVRAIGFWKQPIYGSSKIVT